jgi:hypothetical protein
LPDPESSEEDSEKESAEEDEFAFEFETLEMDRTTEYGTKFNNRPEIYFKNHMAPFAGLLSSLRYESPEVRNKEVSKLFSTGTRKKVLVATSGK